MESGAAAHSAVRARTCKIVYILSISSCRYLHLVRVPVFSKCSFAFFLTVVHHSFVSFAGPAHASKDTVFLYLNRESSG